MEQEKKEWTLTTEAFDRLLKFIDCDPNRAALEYENIRQRLTKLFRWRGCMPFEECADETMDRVARRLVEGVEIRTEHPYALFHGVALNVIREQFRKVERERNVVTEIHRERQVAPNPEESVARQEQEVQRELRFGCLRRCLKLLPSGSLVLIKKYYAEGDILDKNQRKQIADALKISVNALRVRAFRIRAEVEKCALNCMQQNSNR